MCYTQPIFQNFEDVEIVGDPEEWHLVKFFSAATGLCEY